MRSEKSTLSNNSSGLGSLNGGGTTEEMNDDLEAGISFVNGHSIKSQSASSAIYSADEYLEFPPHLNTQSSPIRQQNLDELDCPHLLKGFADYNQHQNNAGSSTLASPNAGDNVRFLTYTIIECN